MSDITSVFQIVEHVVPCQHLREYPRATAFSQEEILFLAVKQYIPLDNANPGVGDITIIGSAANGFPKELYEPLWQDIHSRSKAQGFKIRSIWIADRANSGASGVLNEMKLGNDPSWIDNSRDLLHLTNIFRSHMPLPIIGVGHSMGANELANLALMHPRLFATLILLDPIIQGQTPPGLDGTPLPGGPPARLSAFRRDLWPSMDDAMASFKKHKYFQSWDPRVLQCWLDHALRETPTAIYPNERGSATLKTTKHNVVFNYLRPLFSEDDPSGRSRDRSAFPDADPALPSNTQFYRPEVQLVFAKLKNLRPGCLYIFGEKSEMSPPDTQKAKLHTTGVDVGGSGGVQAGRVDGVSLKGIGHLVAMEAPVKCAEAATEWIGKEMAVWEKERKAFEAWRKKGLIEKQMISEERKRRLGGPPQRSGGSRSGKL